MPVRSFTTIIAAVFLLAISTDVLARRSLRIAFEAWSDALSLGTSDCPGASGNVGQVNLLTNQFSGDQGTTFLVDAYCQASLPFDQDTGTFEYLNSEIFPADEAGLANKIGANTNNAITGIRYTFLDCNRFACETEPRGFQWAFYYFPGNITIVALYGLVGIPVNTGEHFIFQPSLGVDHWNGQRDGFDDQYFCFDGNTFIGTWDGFPVSGGPAAGCAIARPELISCSGFEEISESKCIELDQE